MIIAAPIDDPPCKVDSPYASVIVFSFIVSAGASSCIYDTFLLLFLLYGEESLRAFFSLDRLSFPKLFRYEELPFFEDILLERPLFGVLSRLSAKG